MAKAQTYELESGGFTNRHGCNVCCKNTQKTHRIFWNPTYMNGDADILTGRWW